MSCILPQVEYTCESWLMKNMDPLNDNIVQLMATSNDWLVSTLWKDTTNIVGMAQQVTKRQQSNGLIHMITVYMYTNYMYMLL